MDKPKVIKSEPVQDLPVEETSDKPKFPTKLVRNLAVGAIATAIVGAIVMRANRKDEEEATGEPWRPVSVDPPTTENAV